MSKPEPPPLPQSTPSQFPAPPAPPQQKPLPQAVVEYITAFDKPLTKDEKVAWLGEIAHRVLNGELPQEAYPFLRDKIEGLPEALPSPNRPEEKIPGSDYVHPTGSKPYVALIRENPTFKSTDLSSTRTTSRSKANDSSFSTLVGIILFFVVCGIAYAVGSWYMKSPSIKNDAEIASVADDVVPVKVEIKTDNPFAEESAKEITTDNPFEDGTLETKTDNPFADGSGANNNPHFDPETKIYTYEAEEAKLLGGLQVLTSHPGGLPSTGYTGKGYVENFRERDDICVFDVFIEEDGYYDLDFVSASLNGLFKMNRIILDEKSLGEVKVESKTFTSSRMDRIFLSQGSHSIKYAHTWGHVALDKLVISLTDPLRVRLIDENGFELQLVTDGTVIRTSDFMRQPFLFNNNKIFLESCTDRTTGITVYRVDPMQLNGNIGIGFQYLMESRLPKILINGNCAAFESKKGSILIGWSSASTLTTPKPRKELKVIRAKYGTNDRSSDVTDSVKGFVIGDSLTFRVDNATFGDPAPGSGKNLVLTYSLDGEERTETFNENQNVQVQYDPQDQFFRLTTNGNSTLEFVVAYGLKTLPEKLPTFEEVAQENPFVKELSTILDNPFDEPIATDNPFAE